MSLDPLLGEPDAMATECSRTFTSLKEETGLTKPAIMQSGSSDTVTDGFDVLNFIDFKWDVVSAKELRGRFLVSSKTCQPFGVLHGGITAFLAENLASIGAQVNSNWARVAGIDLNVNHLLSASIGETVIAKATPLRVGKRVQVWDVLFTKPVKSRNASEPEEFATTAVARLTLLVGLPAPEKSKDGNEKLMAIAKSIGSELPPDEITSKL
jgi:1,4-dihydroxy-2-naphthoyl-CoA hydrolase